MNNNNEQNKNNNNQFSALTENITDPCVHCGFCLPTCASYRILGTEMDSPRGRIHTLKAIANNELEIDPTVTSHFDTCLGCYACVTACPSGVRYDKLIEAARPQFNKKSLRKPCENIFRKLLLSLLPYPKRLRLILQTLRIYTNTHIQDSARKVGLTRIFGPQIESIESLLPKLPEENFKDQFKEFNKATGPFRGRVGLVLGCVQRCFDPNVNNASLKVLLANGFDVVIPKSQGCCGAVAHHQGELDQTRQLAEELIKNFSSIENSNISRKEKELDAILVAASGCGHTMKSYKNIINTDTYFNSPVMDIHEFLIEKGLSKDFLSLLKPIHNSLNQNPIEKAPFYVAFHDACHMLHGQQISTQPRELLESIPYLKIKEVAEIGVCCGSAGIYNLIQPDVAIELGKIKVKDLLATKPNLIASANIGCTLQLRRYLKESTSVIHPIEILAISAGLHQSPSLFQCVNVT